MAVDRSLWIPKKSWNPRLRSLVDEEVSVEGEASEVVVVEVSEVGLPVGIGVVSEEVVGAFGVGEVATAVIVVAASEVVAAASAGTGVGSVAIGEALAETGAALGEIGVATATGAGLEAEAGFRAVVATEVTVESVVVEEEEVVVGLGMELLAALPLSGVVVVVVVVAMGKSTLASSVIFEKR